MVLRLRAIILPTSADISAQDERSLSLVVEVLQEKDKDRKQGVDNQDIDKVDKKSDQNDKLFFPTGLVAGISHTAGRQ